MVILKKDKLFCQASYKYKSVIPNDHLMYSESQNLPNKADITPLLDKREVYKLKKQKGELHT